MQILVIILNLATLPAFLFIVIRRVFARQMMTEAKERTDEKYRFALDDPGPPNRFPVPVIDFFDRGRSMAWKFRKIKRDYTVGIRGPRRLATRHTLATLIHVGVTAILVWRIDVAISQLPLGFGVVYLISTAWFLALLHVFTRRLPMLSGDFRSRPGWISWFCWLSAMLMLAVGLAFLSAAITVSQSEPILAALPVLAYFAVVVVLKRVQVRKVDPFLYRKNLLVLRVYGSMRRSFFIFNRLQPLWNNLGSVFTIASPDQVFGSISAWRPRKLPVLLFLAVLAAGMAAQLTLVSEDALAWTAYARVPVLLVAHYAVLYLPLRWLVRSAFLADEDRLYREIMRGVELSPAKNIYPNVHFSCHDDNWRTTVEGVMGVSDVTLMDLRGFTRENEGAAFELKFLVNRFPLDNTVILADQSTDMELFESTLQTAWRQMREESPNHSDRQVRLAVYREKQLATRDLEPLAALLCNHSLRLESLQLDEAALERLDASQPSAARDGSLASINYLFPPDQIGRLSEWRFALHFEAPRWFRKRKIRKAEEQLNSIRLEIAQLESGPLEYDRKSKTVSVHYEVPEEQRAKEGALERYESDLWKILGHMLSCGFNGDIFYEAKAWRDG